MFEKNIISIHIYLTFVLCSFFEVILEKFNEPGLTLVYVGVHARRTDFLTEDVQTYQKSNYSLIGANFYKRALDIFR